MGEKFRGVKISIFVVPVVTHAYLPLLYILVAWMSIVYREIFS
jgi:hypothetical protein